jgi:hypothetical protein
MASERVVTGTATLVFAVLSVVLWQDYLSHSSQVYGERDAAQAQLTQIDKDLAAATTGDQVVQLSLDRSAAQSLYDQAEGRINDMDGWNAPEWKLKNSLRLAAPAAAVLFAAFTLLSILNPLK